MAPICTTEHHEITKRDPRTWSALPFAGILNLGDGEPLELRNCPACQSTLAVPLASPTREG